MKAFQRLAHRRQMTQGFTLVELLAVVAILAILATVSTSNYLEAQTRSKVAAANNNLRVLAVALESYATDAGHYPPASGVGAFAFPLAPYAEPVSVRLIPLTTPVEYISAVPKDLFRPLQAWGVDALSAYDTYDYVDAAQDRSCGLTSGGAWRIASAGPDLYLAYGGRTAQDPDCNARGVDYDSTNGTTSNGDVVRVGPASQVGVNPTDRANPDRPGVLRVPQYLEQW
jgi:prepilin-type N-terminal cleavage/methylation domain-containing protein